MDIDVQTQLLDNDPALREIVRRIADAYQPLSIYLFGSMARGTAGPDSDYDLLVVVRDDAPPELKSSKLAYRSLWGTDVAADVLVCTRSYFDTRSHLNVSLPGMILREGKLLYAA